MSVTSEEKGSFQSQSDTKDYILSSPKHITVLLGMFFGGKRCDPHKEAIIVAKKYTCTVCGYVYDPEKGDPDSGIEPGTAFEDIPNDWVCPVCGAGKEDFEES